MTISDDELARWEALIDKWGRQGGPSSGELRVIITQLRDARRKLAAVERLCADASRHAAAMGRDITDEGYPAWVLVDELEDALAAGEAPTEPATCKHGQTKPHRSCSLRTCPMDHDCPGPVPQGGTTEQEQQQ